MRGDRNYSSRTTPSWTTVLIGVIALLFIILIWRFVSGGSAPDLATAPVSLRMTDETSSALLVNESKKEKTIQANTPLANLDLVEIKGGTAKIAFLNNDKNSLNLNTGTKIRYLGQGTDNKTQFRLENKDLWIQADTGDFSVDLLGVLVLPSSGSVLNVAKNELFTTITVLQGTVTVSVENKTLEIASGQQLNYSTLRTVTFDDLSSRVAPINPETLTSPWMSLNGANTYTAGIKTTSTTPTSETTTQTNTVGGGLIAFESPIDEATIDAKTITVSGKILNPTVARIVISNLAATLDPVKQTFVLKNLPLTNHENNLVYRTYDATGTLLTKGFITVYTTTVSATATATPVSNTASTTAPSNGKAQVSTYKPDKRFKIVAPAADYYETTDKKVRIEGSISASNVASVTINDFKLGSFNGSSWYYFANEEFGNMQEGTNTYTIRYFDKSSNEVYKQLFVIKKNPTPQA